MRNRSKIWLLSIEFFIQHKNSRRWCIFFIGPYGVHVHRRPERKFVHVLVTAPVVRVLRAKAPLVKLGRTSVETPSGRGQNGHSLADVQWLATLDGNCGLVLVPPTIASEIRSKGKRVTLANAVPGVVGANGPSAIDPVGADLGAECVIAMETLAVVKDQPVRSFSMFNPLIL